MTTMNEITAVRRSIRASQEELAQMVGVTSRTIARWEADINACPLEKLVEIQSLSTDELETGSASLRITLQRGTIRIYHGETREPLRTFERVRRGQWDRLWAFMDTLATVPLPEGEEPPEEDDRSGWAEELDEQPVVDLQ